MAKVTGEYHASAQAVKDEDKYPGNLVVHLNDFRKGWLNLCCYCSSDVSWPAIFLCCLRPLHMKLLYSRTLSTTLDKSDSCHSGQFRPLERSLLFPGNEIN